MVKHSAGQCKEIARKKGKYEKRGDMIVLESQEGLLEFQLESNYKNLKISWVQPLKIPNYQCF